ncbi:hypothetical protein SmJEL517_g03406 [Synchytrium microbalum]|uniref:NAD(P)-binding domain-containing protein n=1 Tax=Synchytrium microbalum TaxID=1806994 RepID=A0A507C3S7_9FUNG|nr:uncharacterized protein SmJEL517_g03406 [Synchytrium microbalum]TPX33729.1 hypothetical protein SmJEL517_g03406 [Synchytrium microbalum]
MVGRVVCVTGVAGFIGSHTAEALLKDGDVVVGLDDINDYYSVEQKLENLRILSHLGGDRFKFYRQDIADSEAIRTIFASCQADGHSITHVCHLAARAGVRPSIQSPELYVSTNVNGTVSMLEASRRYNVKNFVYASSSSVYGLNAKIPFAEDDNTDSPVSPYAATKKATELLASTYAHLYQLPVTGLRFFTVFGPRGRPDMAPYMFVDRIANGISINKFGDGTSSRDYTYIDDIVAGILSALDTPRRCEIYNLGNHQTVTLNEFIHIVEKLVDRKAIINQLPNQPGDVPITYADLTKSSRDLGYKPTHTFERGMTKFVKWYNEYRQQQMDAASSLLLLPPSLADCESEDSSGLDSSDVSGLESETETAMNVEV